MKSKILNSFGCCWFFILTLVFSPYSESLTTVADATYVVKKGDTLWDLAFTFLGDPFQWPQIWNANPSISNPHLIYPGQSLVIPGRTRSVPYETNNKQPITLSSPIVEQVASNDSLKDAFDASNYDSTLFASIKSKNPFDRSFYAKIPFLWTGRDPRGFIYPGKGIVSKPTSAMYKQFEKISITPQVEEYFSVGDTLDIYSSIRFVEYEGKTANLIKRVGKCRVLESAPKKVVAELFEQWDVIRGQERVDRATVFSALQIDTLLEPSIAITGTVFTRVEESTSPYPYQTVIVDKGSQDGVEDGDIFAIYHIYGKNGNEKLTCVGIISHVNNSSSSLLLVTIFDTALTDGDKVVLVRKSRFLRDES